MTNNKVFPNGLVSLKDIGKANAITMSGDDGFEITWKNLSFMIEKSFFNGNKQNLILKNLNGYFRSGELTAVMGPSGAGKSSFLRCVCGKQVKGVTGEIKIRGSNRINAAMIDQDDYLWDKFTVKESLTFASKVKNNTIVNHETIITNVVKVLNLEHCLNTNCGKCSGGQRKRISIALELVSKPNILILDEPTSGLDSASCYNTVKTLQELTQNNNEPMAIVATIHQPSARVFNMFDNVYIISNNGQCIYHGPPDELHNYLSDNTLECPIYYNPADFILEIASGEHGLEAVEKLVTKRKYSLTDSTIRDNSIGDNYNLSDLPQIQKHALFLHLWLLLLRSFKSIIREPQLSTLKLTVAIVYCLMIVGTFGPEVGRYSGCPPTQKRLYDTQVGQLFKEFEKEADHLVENFGLLYCALSFIMFNGLLSMALVFPIEMNVFLKEYSNRWYSVSTYFISKTLADIPFLIAIPTVFTTIYYFFTGQSPELWRYYSFVLATIGVSFISQSNGMIFGAMFSHNVIQAAFVTIISSIPDNMFSGFLVRYATWPWYLKPLSIISYQKLVFEIYLISLYGFNRCPPNNINASISDPPWFKWIKLIDNQQKNPDLDEYSYKEEYQYEDEEDTGGNAVKKIVKLLSGPYADPDKLDDSQSLVMSQFGLSDDLYYKNFIIMIAYYFISKFIAFGVLYWKAKHKQ